MVMPGVLLPPNPVFDDFALRAPTSPLRSKDDLPASLRQESAQPRAATPTCLESTSGSGDRIISQGLERPSKRVGWSSPSAESTSPIRRGVDQDVALQCSSTMNVKPIKSILKSHKDHRSSDLSSRASTKLHPPYCYSDFATMLESIIRQLAGTDLDGRFDAYYTLNNVLCAAENAIDPAALTDKMGLLTQFIFRDLTPGTHSVPHERLVPKALTLLGSLLYKPDLARKLPGEFCTQILDFSIASLQAPIVISKESTKLVLFTLANQDFSSKIMSADRCTRLVRALQDLESHVKGRSIVLLRTSIYSKLLQQCRPAMIVQLDWLEHLFADMISDLQDIRTGAVKFGLEASLSLGTDPKVSRAAAELLKTERESGITLVSHYFSRLQDMLERDNSAVLVPRILSVVILFLRGKRTQIEQWPSLQAWLVLFSKCFNRSLYEVKLEANLAWNRFVFALDLDQTTTPSTIKLVRNPILTQFRRKDNGSRAKDHRRNTYSSLCYLLYCSLRPTAAYEQLDVYWDKFVISILGELIKPPRSVNGNTWSDDLKQSCQILEALLRPSNASLWSPTRLLQDAQLKAEELPSVDPRWIRKNIVQVMEVVVPLTRRCFQDLASKGSPISAVWKSLVSAIFMAGSKEIKVSSETMMYLSCLLDMLYQTWRDRPELKGSPEGTFYKSFTSLVHYNIDGLGVLPFTDKLYGAHEQHFMVMRPTRRHEQIQDARQVLHFLILLFTETAEKIPTEEYKEMVDSILRPFFLSRTTRWSTIELATDLALILPKPGEGLCAEPIWKVLADHAAEVLESESSKSSVSIKRSLEHSPEHRMRQITSILEIGITSCHYTNTSSWARLLHAGSKYMKSEAGNNGVSVSMIEPLALHILTNFEQNLDVILTYTSNLLEIAGFPEDDQSPHTKKRLSDTAKAWDENVPFHPYVAFYTCIARSLAITFDEASFSVSRDGNAFLSSFELWLRQVPPPFAKRALLGVETGLLHWAMDKDCGVLMDENQPLLNKICSVWDVVCSKIQTSISSGNGTLKDFENFFRVGFVTKHRPIVLTTMELWNSIHGQVTSALHVPQDVRQVILKLPEQLDLSAAYPEMIQAILSSISREVDLNLTTSQSSANKGSPEVRRQPVSAGLMQEVVYGHERLPVVLHRESPESLHAARSNDLFAIPRASPEDDIGEKQTKRKRPDASVSYGKSKIRKHNFTPKLRHDDSQVLFAPIDSSPFVEEKEGSQILTDRQKEVRKRQEADAAQFPELQSSPRRKYGPAAQSVSLAITAESELPLTRRRLATPGVGPADMASSDDFVTSSPTPKREAPRLLPDSDAIEPPSSPPEVAVKHAALDAAIPVIDLLQSNRVADRHNPVQTATSFEVLNVSIEQMYADQEVDRESSDIIDEDEEVAAQLLHSIEFYSQEYTDEVQPKLLPEVAQEAFEHDVSMVIDGAAEDVAMDTPDTIHSRDAAESAYQDALSTPVAQFAHPPDASLQPPRLPSQDGVQKHTSSWSELDESSMLRVIAPYDASAGSGQGNLKQTLSSIGTDSDQHPTSSGGVATATDAGTGVLPNKVHEDPTSSADASSGKIETLPRNIGNKDKANPSHVVPQKSRLAAIARVEEPGRRKSNRLLPPSSIPETPEPSYTKGVDGDLQDAGRKTKNLNTSPRRTRRSSRLAEASGSAGMSSPADDAGIREEQSPTLETSQESQDVLTTSSSIGFKTSTPSRRSKRKREPDPTSTTRSADAEHLSANITNTDGTSDAPTSNPSAGDSVLATDTAQTDRLQDGQQDVSARNDIENVIATPSIDLARPDHGQECEQGLEVLRAVQAVDGSVSFVSLRTDATSSNDPTTRPVAPAEDSAKTAANVLTGFRALLSTFDGIAMTREQANEMDNLLWECKKKLVEAEERGKQGGK